jgi:putative tricarboxylic transport membrane protein
MNNKAVKANLYAGCFLLMCGIAMAAGASRFEKTQITELGADFMPTITGVLMAILSGVLIIMNALQLHHARESEAARNTDAPVMAQKDFKGVLAAIAVLVVYMALILPLGFILSSVLYMFAQMYLLAEKRTVRNLIAYFLIATITPVSVNYVFLYFFSLMLPAGIFG